MLKWLFGDNAEKSVDPATLSYAELAALNKVTRFFSDKAPDPVLREKVRAVDSTHQSFATDVLGDADPSFEMGAAYSHRIQVTRTGADKWQIHKIIYLDLPKDSAPGLAIVDNTAQPALIGTAKCAFDALEFCAAFQAMALKEGKTVLKNKNREGGDFIHWRKAAEEAGQPTDIDGALIPCALGVPILPSDSNRRFDSAQLKIMRKTAPKEKTVLERIFKQTAEEEGTIPAPPKMPEAEYTDPSVPPKAVTWKDIGRSNPKRIWGGATEPADYLDEDEVWRLLDSVRTERQPTQHLVTHYDQIRGIYFSKHIDPDDYTSPIVSGIKGAIKSKVRVFFAKRTPHEYFTDITSATGNVFALERKDGRYDLFVNLEAKNHTESGGFYHNQYACIYKTISQISRDVAEGIIQYDDYQSDIEEKKKAEENLHQESVRKKEREREQNRVNGFFGLS